jgi:hypothetical protein
VCCDSDGGWLERDASFLRRLFRLPFIPRFARGGVFACETDGGDGAVFDERGVGFACGINFHERFGAAGVALGVAVEEVADDVRAVFEVERHVATVVEGFFDLVG